MITLAGQRGAIYLDEQEIVGLSEPTALPGAVVALRVVYLRGAAGGPLIADTRENVAVVTGYLGRPDRGAPIRLTGLRELIEEGTRVSAELEAQRDA